jgi:hypothetical protein
MLAESHRKAAEGMKGAFRDYKEDNHANKNSGSSSLVR